MSVLKTLVPSYYAQFRCIAERCHHNCCIGWEIDIDPAARAHYRAVDGAFGERLRNSVTTNADGDTCFVLDADERCPFLNPQGLCDIITTLGEDALCQICADHPRFRNDFSTHTEKGVGLCCEAAAALIVGQTAPASLAVLDDDGTPLTPTTAEARLLRDRAALFATACNRRYSLKARERRLLTLVGRRPRPITPDALYALYAPLERLDRAWSQTLERLLHAPYDPTLSTLAVPFENLLVYFLYRHVAGALQDDRFAARAAFAVHSVRLLRLLAPRDETELAELARAYSAEIEYSDENLQAPLAVF